MNSSRQSFNNHKKIRNITERLSIGLSFAPGAVENNLDLDALAEYNKGLLPENLGAVREQNDENDQGHVKFTKGSNSGSNSTLMQQQNPHLAKIPSHMNSVNQDNSN